jgi:hypothetical protein
MPTGDCVPSPRAKGTHENKHVFLQGLTRGPQALLTILNILPSPAYILGIRAIGLYHSAKETSTWRPRQKREELAGGKLNLTLDPLCRATHGLQE